MSISDVDAQAVCISHYAPIANVIQMAHLANQQPGPWEIAKYRTGDVAMGGASRLHRTQMRHGDRALQCFHSTVGLPARSDVSFSVNEIPDIYGLVVIMHFMMFYGVRAAPLSTISI